MDLTKHEVNYYYWGVFGRANLYVLSGSLCDMRLHIKLRIDLRVHPLINVYLIKSNKAIQCTMQASKN